MIKWCAPECTGNYDSARNTEKVSSFSFPSDINWWEKNGSRIEALKTEKSFIPSKHSRISIPNFILLFKRYTYVVRDRFTSMICTIQFFIKLYCHLVLAN